MAKLFGTDGVRGTANVDLTPELALALGKAAGHALAAHVESPRVLIGRDTRESGDMLEAALAAGFCSAGADVTALGVITTPAVAMLTRTGGFAAGAVISASHNPAPENGIKFFGPDGCKLSDDLEAEIEGLAEAPHGDPRLRGSRVGRYHGNDALAEAYMRAACEAVDVSLHGLRVVMDGANGAGHDLNARVLDSLGVTQTRLNTAPDGTNINEGCGSTHPEEMRRVVVEQGADLGIAFDGDGDRVILCDEKGGIVDGDHVMAICGHAWANTPELPHNLVVGTVMSNLGLEKSLESIGVRLMRTPVGDRHVAQALRETGAGVGGEKSGHLIFPRHATTGDGLVAALQVMALMVKSGKSLSELAGVMTEYPQILIAVRVRSREGWDAPASVRAALDEGHRALEGRGRLLVRASGTENVVRVMAEGPDHGEIDAIVHAVADTIREAAAA